MTERPAENQPAPEASVAPATLVQNSINELRRKLTETTDPTLKDVQLRFDAIYEKLPSLALAMLAAFKEVCQKNGYKPGKIQLWMVGGRVQGKPLKADSDIDLIFAVEHPGEGPEKEPFHRFADADNAADHKIITKRAIKQAVSDVCSTSGVPDEFHILSYGSPLASAAPDQLLLGEA